MDYVDRTMHVFINPINHFYSLGAYPMWYVVQKWTKKQAGKSSIFKELAFEVDFHNL